MKVLLINPKQENHIDVNLPKYVDDSRGHIPPLGLLYVASVIEQENEVKVLDLDAGDNLALPISQPDIVGITANTFTIIDTLRTAKEVKEKWEDVKVIVGGMHPSIFPIETLANKYIDYVFIGEAEETINKALKDLHNGKGIIEGNQVDVTKLPHPARHLIEKERYNSILSKGKFLTTMITSRGCPFNCIFCHRKTMGNKFRARTAEQVFGEMLAIKWAGIDEVLIYDDTFTVNRKRVEDICDLIIIGKLAISFDIRTRVDCVDEELLELLKEAGCKRIHYGVEGSSNEILKALRKGITIKQVEQAFKATKKTGIETLAYFIIGSPGETLTDIEHTIRYAVELNPDYCHFAIMTPYPDTPLYHIKMIKDKIKDYWAEFARKPSIEFITPYWSGMDRIELQGLLDKAYKKFYMRPGKIIKEVYKTRSIKGLVKKGKAGLKILAHSRTANSPQ